MLSPGWLNPAELAQQIREPDALDYRATVGADVAEFSTCSASIDKTFVRCLDHKAIVDSREARLEGSIHHPALRGQ